jgi:hypothetical protein
MSFIDNCVTIKLREKILAKLCLDGVISPVDGFTQVSEKVVSGETLLLFDNNLEATPLPNKQQVRGVFIIIKYPKKDDNSETIEDINKSIDIILTNHLGVSFTLPLYNFYSLLNNPVTSDITKLVSSISIENTNNYTITVEALLLLTDKTGVKTDPTSC